jgi:precorrin-4/cobalt-precorrin-4 C11-methyltransferase
VVIWASSLVHPQVLDHARPDAILVDSAALPLEGILPYYEQAARDRLAVARVHSGDPGLYGAIQEQLDACAELDLEVEIVPGVSSYSAAAAAAGRELTYPQVAQSVVLTRLEGGRTPMPAGETIRSFAEHQTTMAVFLSAARCVRLQAELLAGGYPSDTPVVVAHRISWPDELLLCCRLDELSTMVKQHRLWKHTLFLVGPALAAGGERSRLYHPGFFTAHRRADPRARQALRAADDGGRAR